MNTSPPGPRKAIPWTLLKRVATLALFAAVVVLLAVNAQKVDWGEVWRSLENYGTATLLLAALLSALSFGVYSCFDLLARSLTRAWMSVPAVMAVTFVSHALGLTLGVAGVALRFRLYGSHGVPAASVARIWGLSVLTNWLGFLILGGAVFGFGLVDLPPGALLEPGWTAQAMRLGGGGLLAAALAYLVCCALVGGRRVTLLKQQMHVPTVPFAFGQFVLSCTNWMLIAAVMYVLLDGKVDYPTVLGVYLLSAIALSIVDVPGGLGITEGVFIAMLGHRVPMPELLAALVAYRAIFYLAPAVPAVLGYLAIEARSDSASAGASDPAGDRLGNI